MIEIILAPRNMNRAWDEVQQNKASPGIDGVTLARWERNWEANLERLRSQVRSNTYRPNRPKRFRVAKKGGGVRELSRLTVTDKVMQRAVLNVIDPVFEKRFLDCSHAYRPRRSVATAVQQVIDYREAGFRWLLDADIKACFDNLDHAILTRLIRAEIDDWFVLNLTDLWLRAGRKYRHEALGVPMGGVLSPLWCNIYLHQLDLSLNQAGWKLVRYADDFIVLAQSRRQALQAWQETELALTGLKLLLSPVKTGLRSFDQGFLFLGVTFFRDAFSYDYQKQRIQVQGRDAGPLFEQPPDFYA
jgi:group II intron reverse transcriptase/maturase